MIRPELLTAYGDSAAAQAAFAVNVLLDKDVFYALIEEAVDDLETSLLKLKEVLSQESAAQKELTVNVKTAIPMSAGEDIDSLLTAVQARVLTPVYKAGRDTEAASLFGDVSTWFGVFNTGFPTGQLQQRHFEPIVSRINQTGNTEMASDLETALSARQAWNPYTAFYTGSITPYRTTQLPIVIGLTPPFMFTAPDVIDVVADGVTYSWIMAEATPPVIFGPDTALVFQTPVAPAITLTGPFTTVVIGLPGFAATAFPGGIVIASAPGTFLASMTGMFIHLAAVYYEITYVQDDVTVLVTPAPPLVGFVACEVHTPHTFPLTITSPMLGHYGVTYTVDLGSYGSFLEADVALALDAALPPGVVFTIGLHTVTATLPDLDSLAEIDTSGTAGGEYPKGYDAVGLSPGMSYRGITETSRVIVRGRLADGTIGSLDLPTALTGGSKTPLQMATALAVPLASVCLVTYDADPMNHRIVFEGLGQGDTAFLEVTIHGVTYREWGSTPPLPALPAPLLLSYGQLITSPTYDVVLNGTTTILSPVPPAVVSLVELQLPGEKHWASYRIISVAHAIGGYAVVLNLIPDNVATAARVRYVRRPVQLQNVNTTPGSSISVETSPSAAILGLSGALDYGDTTDFVPISGAKPGYIFRATAGAEYRVVSVDDAVMIIDTLVVADPIPGTLYSPGALAMATYEQILAEGFPSIMSLDPETLDMLEAKVDTLLALISPTLPRYEALASEDWTKIKDFCSSRRLELFSLFGRMGGVSQLVTATYGTVRGTLVQSVPKYAQVTST